MIDIRDLRAHPDKYRQSIKLRGLKIDVDKVLELDADRTSQVAQVDQLRAKLNVKGKPSADELKQLQEAKGKLEPLQAKLRQTEDHLQQQLGQIPNLIADGTPEGGEDANRQERTWGKAEKKPGLDHLDLAIKKGWLDFDGGAKVAGSKFYYSFGPLVKLELALVQMTFDLLEQEGFVPTMVPHMVTGRVAEGAGYLPRGEERQIYKIEGQDLNLIATAEMPLTGYHADEIVDLSAGPKLYAGVSPCYRMEAGSYGQHSRGLFRVHQFDKVEMYVFCKPDDSDRWLEKLAQIEENIYQQLEIPYRVVRIATGDMGAPAYKKYDLEYWSPIDGGYREITSCSNCTDYQARRLNIRTRAKDNSLVSVHTLNGTAVAVGRVLVAILENHQDKDGTIHLPAALQKYFGAITIK